MKYPINIEDIGRELHIEKGSAAAEALVSVCILINSAYIQGREDGRKEAGA